jgi:beta-glucosidase/6-phospho-beta-glucosidase/beta-galactosidase
LSKSVKKFSKFVKKVIKKFKKVVKNFVTPGKNPNINNGAIVEKRQWCIEKNKKTYGAIVEKCNGAIVKK